MVAPDADLRGGEPPRDSAPLFSTDPEQLDVLLVAGRAADRLDVAVNQLIHISKAGSQPDEADPVRAPALDIDRVTMHPHLS